MYQTSNNYKSKIYEPSTRHLLKIYIDNVLIDNKYVLGVKPSQELFSNDEFTLGSITAKAIELKLHKSVVPNQINRVYIVSGIENEEVPIGYFNVDDISKEDNYTVTLKLIDDMIKFEFNYDGSELIGEEGYAEIVDVLEDICTKAEVELRFNFFFEYA